MFDNDQPRAPLTTSGLGQRTNDALLRQRGLIPGEPTPATGASTEPVATEPAPAEPPGWEEGLGALPQGYEDGRLVCLARDPSTAFVYWDLSRQQIAQAFDHGSPARAVLKLILLSGPQLREIDVHLDMRGFYLRDLPTGSEFRVELWAASDKSARLLRSSRPVRLPPASPSPLIDEQYLQIDFAAPLADASLEGAPPHHWPAAVEYRGEFASHEAELFSGGESRAGYPPLLRSGSGLHGGKAI